MQQHRSTSGRPLKQHSRGGSSGSSGSSRRSAQPVVRPRKPPLLLHTHKARKAPPVWQAAAASGSSEAGSQQQQPDDGRSSKDAASSTRPPPAAAAATTQPTSPSTAAAASSAAESDTNPVAKARRDLADSWALLKDAAGQAFVPGYKQQQRKERDAAAAGPQPLRYSEFIKAAAAAAETDSRQQQQRQQDEDNIVPLSERLGRLLSGQFVRDREAARTGGSKGENGQEQQRQRQRNPAETQYAALQFELMQRLQQQQPGPAAAAAGPVTVDADGIIDVTPDNSSTTSQQPSAAAAAGSKPDTESSAEATEAETAAAAAKDVAPPEASGFYPAGTQVIVLLMWGVFVLQWVQALPSLWEVVRAGRVLEAIGFMLLAFPDTPLTNTLCLDLPALAQVQQGLGSLLTSGLCNSGFAATYLCCAALQNCGRWLEAGTGQLQLLTVFVICSLFASAAHIFAGRCAVGVAGPGAVLGVYTTWSILATQYMRDVVPLRTIYSQGVLFMALMLALGLLQPAVSAASLLGGVLGGAVAVVIAGPVSRALRWCLALPVMAGLLLLRLLIDLLQVLWYVAVLVAAAVWQFVTDTVKTVRGL